MSHVAPVLVTGPDRSGTSLMFALLASHSNISMVRRTNLWRWFNGQFGELSRSENFERCLATMLRYKRMEHLQPDPDRIRKEFWEGPATYGRLFRLVHEHHAQRAGKSRWGDKSLHTEHHADSIFGAFPDAKMIHMIRDPRDRYASILKRYQNKTRGVASTTGRWLASAKMAERNQRKYADNYLIVRYETLAKWPERTMRQVCAFIDEPYDPSMLSMRGVSEYAYAGGNSSFEKFEAGTISTRSIGRFRSVLSPDQTRFIQVSTGRMMTRLGYAIEPTSTPLPNTLWFYLERLPVDLIRMKAWIVLDKRAKMQRPPAHRMVERPQSPLENISYAR